LNSNTIRLFFQGDDTVVKDALNLSVRFLKQQVRELAPLQRHISPAGQFGEYLCAEIGNRPTLVVYDAHLPHVITDAIYLVEQAHPLRKIIA
jgi:hypothetical protein